MNIAVQLGYTVKLTLKKVACCSDSLPQSQPYAGGGYFIESLNPNSIKVSRAKVEPSLANAPPGQIFQFERHGYFMADRVDHVQGFKPVFNLAVELKDGWGK